MKTQKMSAHLQQRAEGTMLMIYNKLQSLGLSERTASVAVYPIVSVLLLSVPFVITSLLLTAVFVLFCSSFVLAVFLCGIAFFVSCVCGVIFMILIITACTAGATLIGTGFVMMIVLSLSIAALPLIGVLRASGRADIIPSFKAEARSTAMVSDPAELQLQKAQTVDAQKSE